MEKFARKDSITGKGINEGYCFGDGEFYCLTKAEATKKAKGLGYKTLEEAHKNDAYYWTQWEEIEDDENWYDKEGNEHVNCFNCHEQTPIIESFKFCSYCLTHL